MLDCMSNGRLISGFARGIPREYQVHNVPLAQSRARFEEAFDIIRKAWTDEVFSYRGEFWSYKDVAMWPRPVQQPHPPIWMPVVGSKELIEFAARHDLPITPGARPLARIARRHHPLLRPVPFAGRTPNYPRSPCVPNTPTAMEVWSHVGDEGRPLGADDQELASNHRELLS